MVTFKALFSILTVIQCVLTLECSIDGATKEMIADKGFGTGKEHYGVVERDLTKPFAADSNVMFACKSIPKKMTIGGVAGADIGLAIKCIGDTGVFDVSTLKDSAKCALTYATTPSAGPKAPTVALRKNKTCGDFTPWWTVSGKNCSDFEKKGECKKGVPYYELSMHKNLTTSKDGFEATHACCVCGGGASPGVILDGINIFRTWSVMQQYAVLISAIIFTLCCSFCLLRCCCKKCCCKKSSSSEREFTPME